MCNKWIKLSVFFVLMIAVVGLQGCSSSRKTTTYPKRRHKCNCPHFSYSDVVKDSTYVISISTL